jgi:hypothetical protein
MLHAARRLTQKSRERLQSWWPKRGGSENGRRFRTPRKSEIQMRFYAIVPIGALIVLTMVRAGSAEDCGRQFSAEQHQVYASLSAANQHILSTQIKDKNGQPASCDFQRGLLDILANYTPDKRDADFKQLLDKMLIHTP